MSLKRVVKDERTDLRGGILGKGKGKGGLGGRFRGRKREKRIAIVNIALRGGVDMGFAGKENSRRGFTFMHFMSKIDKGKTKDEGPYFIF